MGALPTYSDQQLKNALDCSFELLPRLGLPLLLAVFLQDSRCVGASPPRRPVVSVMLGRAEGQPLALKHLPLSFASWEVELCLGQRVCVSPALGVAIQQ